MRLACQAILGMNFGWPALSLSVPEIVRERHSQPAPISRASFETVHLLAALKTNLSSVNCFAFDGVIAMCPAYQNASRHRHLGADYAAVIVEGA